LPGLILGRLSRHSLNATWQLATSNDGYTYVLLIVPSSFSLTYLKRELLDRHDAVGHRLESIATTASGGLSASILSLVVWWIAVVIACFGMEIFRSHLFPLCFLFLIVPLPESAVN
jgi:hypothetical protein